MEPITHGVETLNLCEISVDVAKVGCGSWALKTDEDAQAKISGEFIRMIRGTFLCMPPTINVLGCPSACLYASSRYCDMDNPQGVGYAWPSGTPWRVDEQIRFETDPPIFKGQIVNEHGLEIILFTYNAIEEWSMEM